jgi:hypothetical protein
MMNDILDSIQIPNLRIERDYARDEIIFTNLNNHKSARLDRFELENSKLPVSIISDIINQIMPWDHTMQGSGGGIQHIVNGGGGAIGATGMPYYLDDPHEIDLKTKLFSYAEQMLIADVKNSIRKHFIENFGGWKFNMEKIVIAGGCFASMINREPVNDYDVFMLDDDSNRMTVESISVSPLSGDVRVGDSNYMQNDKIEKTVFVKNSRIQYINTKYKTREELIKHFDFKHCCVSYDFSKDKLYITREVYDLIKAKKLVHNSDKPPALWRYEKFHDRGWKSDPVIVAA